MHKRFFVVYMHGGWLCLENCVPVSIVSVNYILEHCLQEKEKRREELKRLKNLKKREILDKIEKLNYVTGDTSVGFTENDVEGEFDEREYDEMMKVGCRLPVFNIYASLFLNLFLYRCCV